VITLGQLRAHELTWANFKENVIDPLGADLAVCVPNDAYFDSRNPYYQNAKFRWLVPDTPDVAATFDRIQQQLGSSEEWRILCHIEGLWLGKITQNREGAGALQIALHWFMSDNIQSGRLTEIYDRFIVTRSDFYYFCPHPPLECLDADNLWIPDGEDYGGLCDRHLIVSAADVVVSCNLIDDLLIRPHKMREAMIARSAWNIEQITAFHLSRNGLISKVKRFPYIMCLVRAPGDPTTTFSTGTYTPDLGMMVKYPSELRKAKRYRKLIRSRNDWQLYFTSRYFTNRLAARIYTAHGVDKAARALNHGICLEFILRVLRRPIRMVCRWLDEGRFRLNLFLRHLSN
jgi:hypothetical protein